MEVHHPHHPTHKKKWFEYIIEFVMLFTAVTLGFFAENIREGITEKHKKQELMKIVASDLKRDMKQLEFHRLDASTKIVKCDSIHPVLKMDPAKIKLKQYYYLLLNHMAYWDFNANDKSRNEASAMGYLTNDENAEIAYNISKVNFFILDYKTLEQESVRLRTQLKDLAEVMTEHEYYNYCLSFRGDLLPDVIGIKPFNSKDANKTSFLITNYKLIYRGYIMDIDSINVYSNKAIELINKKYN